MKSKRNQQDKTARHHRKKAGKTSAAEQTRRLMQAWVMDVAAYLMDEFDMSRRQAMKQAYLVRDVMDGLGRGRVYFFYRKTDGRLRLAHGTLCPGVDFRFDRYVSKNDDRKTPTGPRVFRYWDLHEGGFRSFAPERLVYIEHIFIRDI